MNQRQSSSSKFAGSNLVGMGRIAVHACNGRLLGWSSGVGPEAMGKACGVPMAIPQGQSWAPIPLNGQW